MGLPPIKFGMATPADRRGGSIEDDAVATGLAHFEVVLDFAGFETRCGKPLMRGTDIADLLAVRPEVPDPNRGPVILQ